MIESPKPRERGCDARHWPILMRGPLVRATLADLKTVTRRLDLRWLKAKPGELLYVKETWAVDRSLDDLKPSDLGMVDVEYQADGARSIGRASFDRGKTRVSLFMQPRFARLWLDVVSVREERLRDITDEDAQREGVRQENGVWLGFFDEVGKMWTTHGTAREAFRDLWWSINGAKPGARWEDDPLVVRIEFKRVERPEKTEVARG